ncbi:hypothetical protein [Methylobacterium sp. JK268]
MSSARPVDSAASGERDRRPAKRPRARVLPLPITRMLTRAQAAAYLNLGPTSPIPVAPKRLRPGKQGLRYDLRDLDVFLDNLERDVEAESAESLLDRLDHDQGPRSRR